MSRKQSYDADLTSSSRPNISDRLGDDLYPSKKYHTYFDKLTSSTLGKHFSRETSFTSTPTTADLATVKKLPDTISSIR